MTGVEQDQRTYTYDDGTSFPFLDKWSMTEEEQREGRREVNKLRSTLSRPKEAS